MKKLLSLLLSLALILTLAACGSSPDVPSVPTDDITDVGVTEIATETAGDSTGGTDSTTSESIITETVTQTVTDASGKPVTEPDGKPVTTVVTTIITTRPTYGTGSASASAPKYTGTPIGHPTGSSTSKSTGNSTSKSTGNSTSKSTGNSTSKSAGNSTSKSTGNSTTTTTTTTAKIPSISIGGIIINTTNVTIPTTSTTTKAVTEDQRLVDSLFTLSTGQSKSGVTLTGVVTYVKEVSSTHGNATFDLQVQGVTQQKTIYCYRVTPIDITQLQVQEGQTLILTGTVLNYKGTIEFYPATYQIKGGAVITTTTTRPVSGGAIDKNGIYDSKEDVALYIHTYGCLPKNYVTKNQYNNDKYLCVGGDRFQNKEGRLPAGETYYECDIDTYGTTNRGAKRIVWTKSGIVYYTADHYETFTKLYGAR